MILLFRRKMEDDLSQETHGSMIFSVYAYRCYKHGAMTLCQKKNQRWSSPKKIHLNVIENLDLHSRKGSNIYRYFYGDLYRHFDMFISSKKKQGTYYIWLKFDFFFNLVGRIYFTMKNLHYFVPFIPKELYLEDCLSANQGNCLSIRKWVIIPKI